MKDRRYPFGEPFPISTARYGRAFTLFASALLLHGCVWLPLNTSHEDSNYYNVSAMCQVEPGDTLQSLAAEYCTTPGELAKHNRLKESAALRAGTVLKIPPRTLAANEVKSGGLFTGMSNSELADASRLLGPSSAVCERPAKYAMEVPKSAQHGGEGARGGRAMDSGRVPANFAAYQVCARPGQASTQGMCWPVIGRVSRPYHLETNHRGLDICAEEGTPIVAAKTGKVVYSANELRGFGNMIIVDHGGELATIYAHNRRNLVQVGQSVKRGQKIAEVGQTGNATAPHCHFEVRQKAKPMNPRPLLP